MHVEISRTRGIEKRCTTGQVQLSFLQNRRGDIHLTKFLHYCSNEAFSAAEDALRDVPTSLASSSFTTASTPLSFVNYNIWNFAGPADAYLGRVAAIARQIEDAHADVVALQEVRYTTHEHPTRLHTRGFQIDDLMQHLRGYQFVFAPTMAYIEEDPSTYDFSEENKWQVRTTVEGLAILSKSPIVEVESSVLSRNFSDSDDAHQRALLRARLSFRGKLVDVYTTHSSLSETARRRNAEEITETLRLASHSAALPTIVSGDFNEESGGFLPRALQKLQSPICKDAATLSVAGTRDLWTFTTLHASPKKRIDFTFVCPDTLHVAQWSPVEIDKYMVSRTNGKPQHAPSDHRATLLQIHLP